MTGSDSLPPLDFLISIMAEPVSEKPTEVAATVPEVPDITAESSTAIATTDAVMEDAAVLEKMQKAMKQSAYR